MTKTAKKKSATKKRPAKAKPPAKRSAVAAKAKTSAKPKARAKKVVAKKATKTAANKVVAKKVVAKKTAMKAVAKKHAAPAAKAKKKFATKAAPAKARAKKPTAPAKPPRELVTFEQIQHFSAPPERIYGAWLDGATHAAFTGGGKAEVDARVGGKFSAWNGYIQGKNVELTAGERIVQSWRTSDFPAGYPDSLLELRFVPESGGTRLHLRHVGVPASTAERFSEGWHAYYWQPLRAWLATQND